MLNFKVGAVKCNYAFKKFLPHTIVKHCYFHFCQNTCKNVCKNFIIKSSIACIVTRKLARTLHLTLDNTYLTTHDSKTEVVARRSSPSGSHVQTVGSCQFALSSDFRIIVLSTSKPLNHLIYILVRKVNLISLLVKANYWISSNNLLRSN